MTTVTDLSDTASDTGSLRFALANATNGELIDFSPGLTGTIPLGSTLSINTGVTIDGGGVITISGGNLYGDFSVNASDGNTVALNNLAINDGRSLGTSGFPSAQAKGGNAGGGIYATSGNLTLQNDSFSNDTAAGGQGSNAGANGLNGQDKGAGAGGNAAGAVYIDYTATVTSASNLTFTNDTATGGMGGAPDDAHQTPGANGAAYQNSNNPIVNAAIVCYCAGTLIRTARGDVAVENLAVGDLAVTASGGHRPIRWIGSSTIHCRDLLLPSVAWPVRVAAHAFGPNQPVRDLYLSPQHAVAVTCLEEVLIPIRHLINFQTIAQVPRDEVTYWHVELDSHDLLVAEGLAAESFLDTQGRENFFKDQTGAGAGRKGMNDFCRPLVQNGPIVTAMQAQLSARARSIKSDMIERAACGALRGYIDIVEPHAICGWAQDIGYPEAAVVLDVLLDDVVIQQVVAHHFRGDLANAGVGDGYHAFDARVTQDLRSGTVVVRRAADAAVLDRKLVELAA